MNSERIQAVSGNQLFRTIAEEILAYVVCEMTYVGAGADDLDATDKVDRVAFCSTQDADSEGEGGKFFVWTPEGIRTILGNEEEASMAAYGVTRHGNFEGRNILEFVSDIDQRPALTKARQRLFETREERVHPGRDDVQLAQARQLPSNTADPVGCIAVVPLLHDRGQVEAQAAVYVCDAPVPGRALSDGTGFA